MKAYIAIKFHKDYSNKETVEVISRVFSAKGHETVCMIRDHEQEGKISLAPRRLMTLAFQQIDSSDLMVADITEKGIGVGIECGYAYARNIPVIITARKGIEIPATLMGIYDSIIYYEDLEHLEENLQEVLLNFYL